MTTEQIISICISALNLLNFVFYFWILKKNSKTVSTNDFTTIKSNIPTYVRQAKTLYGNNSLSITNYVLAMLNKDCENLKIKYKQNKLKKEIKKEIQNPTQEATNG